MKKLVLILIFGIIGIKLFAIDPIGIEEVIYITSTSDIKGISNYYSTEQELNDAWIASDAYRKLPLPNEIIYEQIRSGIKAKRIRSSTTNGDISDYCLLIIYYENYVFYIKSINENPIKYMMTKIN